MAATTAGKDMGSGSNLLGSVDRRNGTLPSAPPRPGRLTDGRAGARLPTDQEGLPLMWKGTVTMLEATPIAFRSLASTFPSWFRSFTTFGASL